ncbi:hypothetical protein B0A48_08585 [Cryoendolithus antarcticus]|uniref:Phosphoinositide phospholipase C n=1 Tax=Cryoendolithus antarcticus TaxID=1507870 RepID=A0A1V8T5W1_9PEZI|nr:hypothetical protein B0A48_08585 [Cryoendolithus antarcticus]
MRRRSDSNGASDADQDISDCEPLPPTKETEVSPISRSDGLGISLPRPSNASSVLSGFEGGIAPAIHAVLEQGTWCDKISAKKTKRIKIWLDTNAARVCWHPTNSAKSFFIDDVREIRVGADARNARDDAQVQPEDENRMISIIYQGLTRSKGSHIKYMHLRTPDAYITNLWVEALDQVTRERTAIMNALSSSTDKSEVSINMAWSQAMSRKAADQPAAFTLEDARRLCRQLEINCTPGTVKTHFDWINPERTGQLSRSQFKEFVNSFKERKDIQHEWRNLTMGTDREIDEPQFLDFLRMIQKIDVAKDVAHWSTVFDKFAKAVPADGQTSLEQTPRVKKIMNAQGFKNFLTSSWNAPLKMSKGDEVLDRPINEYFISSSHNTYLLGRQVAGSSSVEGYVAALVKGCRCIEIDCWDGDDGRPVVTHGRTMTTRIAFADCVSVISRYAFHSTPYPLIISLEVHCSAEQQQVMVDLMLKHWADELCTEPIMSNSINLPSPEELKNKILIKVKASEESGYSQGATDTPTSQTRSRSLSSALANAGISDSSYMTLSPRVASPPGASPLDHLANGTSTPRGSTMTMTPSVSSDDSDEVAAALERSAKRRNTSKIIPELGALGVYAQGIKYAGFTAQNAKTYNHVFSFAENTFIKRCTDATDSKAMLEKHNMRHLMRVYPGARRIDSSNFNPLQAWRRGVQMAALNWQTYDIHMQMNQAMFAAGSDRLGYVLKPEELRHAKHLPIANILADGLEHKEKKGKKLVKFDVNVISAQRLPRPRNTSTEGGMNPYVEVEMYCADEKSLDTARGEGGTNASARDGMLGIGSPLRHRTRIIEGNGFDPQFNTRLALSVQTKHQSLIFVRWTVWNSPEANSTSTNNTLLATFTAKLDSLQQGLRHIPLFNPSGEQYRDAKLFVKIHKEAPVALSSDDYTRQLPDLSASPRPEPPRTGRTWPRFGIFSRSTSERRRREQLADPRGSLSRTSSMERTFLP